ncbi:glyceraldehyde 3-phosphate dehydrogenase [Shimia isoporae]|uniref:Glyceraldehyde 3-phosphate dehydrogenase n=1 Tax=Shimia isoporae TaxID=647720 RepID=A0A4R1NKM3_9RHOB|nr:glyceraldehyde 3-phosphate dehydrogenase NAD-binding domain-containing protein [Shimia isoporae]TCL08866.1 glyceraldehyde 3-phosphate dehydrogenase [Shimia isoporae]
MSAPKIKIFINGFGRIGRTVLRILAQGAHSQFDVVGINDIESLQTCAYLFEYDSVFGAYRGEVIAEDGMLAVDGLHIPFHAEQDLSAMDLSDVDVVLECTGMAGARAVAERGLAAGAGAVLISGPSDEADVTIVMGANEGDLQDQKIVSNASCTTNALAPLLRVLDQNFGLISGHMTTVHCYTGSQPTVDKPRADLARSRAAALSMVPTTTSAQRMIDKVLPALKGRVEARAIRVPTASVSAIDLTIQAEKAVSVEAVNSALRAEAENTHLIGWTEKPLVSTDLRARPESLVLSGPETSVSVGGLLRVFGWYDNEWGFSNRMLDMAERMGRR